MRPRLAKLLPFRYVKCSAEAENPQVCYMTLTTKITVKSNLEDMKMKRLFLISTALLALVSCSKTLESVPGQDVSEMVTVTAKASNDNTTKVTMGAKSGTAYPMSWDESETTYLREIVRYTDESTPLVSHYASNSFTKTDAHSGSFEFSLEKQTAEAIYDYVAVYPSLEDPKGSPTHGVRYGGEDSKNRVSFILNHTVDQVPEANAPDQSTHICVATDLGKPAQATSLNLNYSSLVGYGKMTVKNFPELAPGETVTKITVSAPSGKIMTGRMFYYFNAAGTHDAGDVIAYSGTTKKNFVTIDPQNITFNTTGFDVWFTTLPFSMDKDEAFRLEVKTSADTYTASITLSRELSFKAGVVSEFVYDYLKGQPQVETKKLNFDFSGSALAGWPTSDKWKTVTEAPLDDVYCTYQLDDTDYQFVLTQCKAATDARIAWTGTGLTMYAAQRFVGLPVLTGYKLVKVECTQGTGAKSSRMGGITSKVTDTTTEAYSYVAGGEQVAWNGDNANPVFILSNTVKDTMYYLTCTGGGIGVSRLVLTYEKAE